MARDLLASRLGRRGRPLRLLGVTMSNFMDQAPAQGDLFADPTREKNVHLDQLMDQVHERFGAKLRRGSERE